MKKELGIIVDGFAGQNDKELAKKGMFLIPQQVIIKGKTFLPGKDGQKSNVLKEISADPSVEIKTSTPSIGQIEEAYSLVSKKYEKVLFITMSRSLSNTFSVATVTANEFDNVYAIDTTISGYGITYLADHLRKMYKDGKTMEEIIEFVKTYSRDSITIISPRDSKRLVAGGRVSGLKKLVLSAGGFVPSLLLNETGFQSKGLKRSFKKTISSMRKYIETHISNLNEYIVEGIHTGDTLNDIKNEVDNMDVENTNFSLTTDTIVAHTGSGVGFTVYRKLD